MICPSLDHMLFPNQMKCSQILEYILVFRVFSVKFYTFLTYYYY